MSMAKPSEVIQRGKESPSEFYERLCEACILYTPIDPEAAGSQVYSKNVSHQVTHEFLYIPEHPVPLLGRDLLSKLGAQVTFPPRKLPPHERPTLQVGSTTYLLFLLVIPQDEWRLHDFLKGNWMG